MTMLFSCTIRQNTTSWNQHGLVPLSPAHQLCGLCLLGPPPCFCLCHISCFKAPFLGSLLLGPPVSPFASSHPCSLTGLWSPSPLCCPLGSLHHEPLLPTTFLLSSPFHPITQPSRLPLLQFTPLSPLHVKILSLGRGLGRGGGWDKTKGEDFLDVVQTEKDRWKK